MDCFAFISKTKVSSRRNAEGPDRFFMRRIRTSLSNNAFPLDFISRTEEPRLLLIVSEHACRCGYSRCRGFLASKYASDAKVDGDQALYLPCLYYFLWSDAKAGFGHFLLLEASNLMTSVLATWTLGTSVIPQGVMRNLSFGMLVL